MMYEGTVSEIRVFAGGFETKGWNLCDGRTLSISSNTALFSLLGTRFGGNGTTSFALPNLVHPVQRLSYLICTRGMYPNRSD